MEVVDLVGELLVVFLQHIIALPEFLDLTRPLILVLFFLNLRLNLHPHQVITHLLDLKLQPLQLTLIILLHRSQFLLITGHQRNLLLV